MSDHRAMIELAGVLNLIDSLVGVITSDNSPISGDLPKRVATASVAVQRMWNQDEMHLVIAAMVVHRADLEKMSREMIA